MAGEGHILDMLKRNEQNRALQSGPNRRGVKARYDGKLKGRITKFNYPDISPEELAKLKKEIRKHARKEKIKEGIFFTIFSAIVFTAFWSFFNVV